MASNGPVAATAAGDELHIVVGTGYVGRRVLERLPPGRALGLSRSQGLSSGPVHLYDLDAGGALPLTLPDAYRMLYTVAPAAHSDADVRLQHFLEALQPAPAAFVYISTTGVYGNRGGAIVTESSALCPATPRARRRRAAEETLRKWSGAAGVRLCILRTPGIYGPGRLGLERIRAGSAVLREADANPGNRIHVDDLVSCCLAALFDAAAAGVFNVGDGDLRSSTAFTREVARQAGLTPPPEISREQAAVELSAGRLSFLAESRRVDTRRMRDVLGVMPRYADAAQGIRASLLEEGYEPVRDSV